MNPELYVPIKIIAGFKMVKNLTTDIQLITEVLKSSKEVVVHENNELVRPNVKTQRSTLILRDIDSNTPVSEIEEIFKAEGCAAVKSIKSEFGNTWFITFETETEALTTLNIIRKATFKGQPIQARSKSENLLKKFVRVSLFFFIYF
jgi:la-related protein 4